MTVAIDLLVRGLNNSAKESSVCTLSDDSLYENYLNNEQEDRLDFLSQTIPAFIFSLKTELETVISKVNNDLRVPSDRVQLHVNHENMTDLLINSNIELSKQIHKETSIEVCVSPVNQELVENYRRHDTVPLQTNELCLFAERNGSLRVATQSRSFSPPEYASDLLERFLKVRRSSC